MVEGVRRVGWRKLLVAGGSPGTHGDLEQLCGDGIELRFVTEKTSPSGPTVAPLLEFLVLVVHCVIGGGVLSP